MFWLYVSQLVRHLFDAGTFVCPFRSLLLCFLLDFFLSGMLPKLWRNNLDDTHLVSMEFSQISPQNLCQQICNTKLSSNPNKDQMT